MIFPTKNRRISGWQKVRFVGVKKNKDDSYSMLFRLVDYDEWASVYIGRPPFKSDSLTAINDVHEANNKKPIADGDKVNLPLYTDEDKQELDDVIIAEVIKKDNGYLDINGIKSVDDDADIPF